MTSNIIEINNLKMYFDISKNKREKQYVKAVNNVSFNIKKGEVLGLVGESGSGKSTIAYTLVGMYNATSGNMTYKGNSLPKKQNRNLDLKKDIQIVFQDPGSSLNKHQTIREILELPLRVHKICTTSAERTKKIKNLLEMVELPTNYLYKSPTSIGSGERQMIAIARALACEPSFLILDEPTSSLDVSIQAKIINKLMEIQNEKKLTYLFITHDLSLMRNIASRVAILYLGKVAEIAPTDEFFKTPIHPYTQMLLSSIPVISEQEEKLKPKKIEVKGEIPSPVNIPTGCSFHMRCPLQYDKCKIEDPYLLNISENHLVRCHRYKESMKELGLDNSFLEKKHY